MTQDELDRLDALANAATPGPWGLVDIESVGGYEVQTPDGWTVVGYNGPERTDAAFIAAARDAVPALVAEVKRLRASLEKIAADEMGGDEWYVDTARKALEGA